jgi:Rrf2 family protein
VTSVKGAQGGYVLARRPNAITVYDILSAVELSLFEGNDETVSETAPEIEKAVTHAVFEKLDAVLEKTLREITLEQLVLDAERHKTDGSLMFYI